MNIIVIPLGFVLWYLAYEAKPNINDGIAAHWEEENIIKRNKLINIIKASV